MIMRIWIDPRKSPTKVMQGEEKLGIHYQVFRYTTKVFTNFVGENDRISIFVGVYSIHSWCLIAKHTHTYTNLFCTYFISWGFFFWLCSGCVCGCGVRNYWKLKVFNKTLSRLIEKFCDLNEQYAGKCCINDAKSVVWYMLVFGENLM